MATNMDTRRPAGGCDHDEEVLGDRSCLEDPLACHLATALASAEDGTARYHLREALQYRLTEE